MNEKSLAIIDDKQIQNLIYTIQGKQVMIDSYLAELYQVTTKRLNGEVTRNKDRFPSQFMFQLTESEFKNLRSQFATSCDSCIY